MSIETDRTEADVFAVVLQAEDFRCPRPQLERRFKDLSPLAVNDAIETLLADGALVADGEEVQAALMDDERSLLERLAGAVNVVLLTSGRPALTFEQVCAEAERDFAVPEERREVLLALILLDYCQLATQDEDGLWRSTRAAVWAERLAF